MQIPSNQAWIAQQETQRASNFDTDQALKSIRNQFYPEFKLEQISRINKSNTVNEMKIMASQRQIMRNVMRELIQLNLNKDEPKSHGEKKSTERYITRTWHEKSQAIFFYLHPRLGDRNVELTCTIFGMNCYTFMNWIQQPRYFSKWTSFVQNFTFADIIDHIPLTHKHLFAQVPATSQLQLPDRYMTTNHSSGYISSFGPGSRQGKRKAAQKGTGSVYITKKSKSIGSGRLIKYVQETKYLHDSVILAWETGSPLTRTACYLMLIAKFGATQSEWSQQMKATSGEISPSLSQWLTRTLERIGFSVRKESISQSVPLNWMTIAFESCGIIRDTMRAASVTRLVNMDEMFINFYPKEKNLIAPINSKRVGSNRKEDSKKGCTVVVACEMFASQVIAPFVIMDGKPDGYLARRYSSWEGPSSVHFQENHWMDKNHAIMYLDWLKLCFPDDKIGLIWDHAAAHKSLEVLQHASTLDISVAFVPAGLTSVIQICDQIANKPLKQAFKRMYCAHKLRTDPGPGNKYSVHRDDILNWIEDATRDFNEKQGESIASAFEMFGQDHRAGTNDKLTNYLISLRHNSIYGSLLDNQIALDME